MPGVSPRAALPLRLNAPLPRAVLGRQINRRNSRTHRVDPLRTCQPQLSWLRLVPQRTPSKPHLASETLINAHSQGRKHVKRTSATTDKPPYPTIGECLRFIVGAFDLRGHGDETVRKRLDRLANEGDYDWTLFPQILDQMIWRPLRKCTDEEFANFIATKLIYIRDSYTSLLGTISLDALTRDEALPALAEHYFIPLVSGLIQQSRREFGGPDPILLLAPAKATANGKADNFNPIEAVLQWFFHAHTGTFGQVLSQLYDDANDPGRIKRDLLSRHIRGRQIPDAAAVVDIVKTVQSRRWYRPEGPTQQLLARWLFIARALVWAEDHIPQEQQLRSGLMRWTASGSPAEFDVGMPLSTMVVAKGNRFPKLKMAGGRAFLRTGTKQSRSAQQIVDAIEEVKEFRREFERAGRPHFALYMLHWCEARLSALQERLDDALASYEQAADLALYRSGDETKRLLKEAVCIAAHLGKKATFKRLIGRSIALDLHRDQFGQSFDELPDMEEFAVQFFFVFPAIAFKRQAIATDDHDS